MFPFIRSIRFRLTLWFLGVFALVILLLSGFLYLGLQRVLLENVDASLGRAAQRAVSAPVTATLSNDDVLGQLNLLSLAPARLVSLEGAVLKSDALFPANVPADGPAMRSASAGNQRFETLAINGVPFRLLTAPVRVNGDRVAAVQVAQRMDAEQETLTQVRALLLVVIPFTLVLAAFGGWFLAGRALAPMEHVRRDVEGIIGHTDLSRRVGQHLGDDEVGRLARTFDGLLERVQQAMIREKQFTADASHELRSPLTVLKGEISVALSRDRSAGDYRESLAGLNDTVDEMSVLVDDLLALSRASNGSLKLEALDARALSAQVCERLEVIAQDKRITLSPPNAGEPVMVRADKMKLQRVINNLVDNALRYTPAGGAVRVDVACDGTQATIVVQDTGIGIAAEHQAMIFERFYRTDESRARDSGGSGLGLPIAQAIIQAHGGEMTVQSTPGMGSTFRVMLPLRKVGL
jgi:heavy metal sensor kinase